MFADFIYPVVVSYMLSEFKSSSFTFAIIEVYESIKQMDITIVASHLAKILSSLLGQLLLLVMHYNITLLNCVT